MPNRPTWIANPSADAVDVSMDNASAIARSGTIARVVFRSILVTPNFGADASSVDVVKQSVVHKPEPALWRLHPRCQVLDFPDRAAGL